MTNQTDVSNWELTVQGHAGYSNGSYWVYLSDGVLMNICDDDPTGADRFRRENNNEDPGLRVFK